MIDLKDYGFTERYCLEKDTQDLIPGRVTEVHRELYRVVTANGEGNARLKGTFYLDVDTAQDFPAVGDFVLLRYNPSGDSQIVEICPRKSKFSRSDYSGHNATYVKTILEQVVAANFDYVFIMASLNYDFNVNRILRYIAAAWESGGIPVVLLTKADLVEDYAEQLLEIQNQALGVEVIVISALSGTGLDLLEKYTTKGTTLVFLGSSGVGKSTLVNALAGEEIMNVNTIRDDDSKGRHTTTHRQLALLKNGVMIIDTPGMRELGMWDTGDGLGEAFYDIETLFAECKFSDCTHTNEPGCAIRRALEDGSLERSRWVNYLKLKSEIKFTENKSAYLRERREFGKRIDKDVKARQKLGRRS